MSGHTNYPLLWMSSHVTLLKRRIPVGSLVCLAVFVSLVLSQSFYAAAEQTQPSSALIQAKAQLAKHEFTAAEASVWKVLSNDSNNVEGLLLLGEIRASQERLAEAETLFQRVVQLDPKSFSARLSLAKAYLADNKLPDASEQYKAAEELAPQNIEVRVTLARLQAAAGDFANALATLDRIPAAKLPTEAVPIKVGALASMGHSDQAIKLAETVKNPAIALALAEVFLSAQRPNESLKLLNTAAASGKKPPARFYFIKARAFDAIDDKNAAHDNFQKAVALDPSSEEFLLGAAEFEARTQNHSEAFAILQRAYKRDPNSPKVLRPYILEGSFAGKSADVQDAAEQLAAKSDDPQDLYVVAAVLIKNLRQDEAVPLLEKYVAAVPGNAPAWVGLGLGYEDLKRFDDAQKAFESALKADPNFAEAEYQLGVLISTTGNSALATQHYERALQLNPRHTLALEKLGGLYLQSGQFEKARDVLLKSESLDPTNRQVEYGLALVYGKLGNREEAKIHMERFEKYGKTGSTEKK